MYAALLNKKLVLAVDEARLVVQGMKKLNASPYRCPHCQKKVILILSQEKAAFFKHLVKYENALGEKEEHHLAKMMLQAAFTAAGFKAQTEISLANGQLRADVLVSAKLALEVQCAPLSRAEFKHRHHLYQKIKVLDLWIVGHRHFLGKRLKQTQLIFFRQNRRWGSYYLEVDAKHNFLRLKYNIWQEAIKPDLHYQVQVFPLDERGVERLWSFKPVLRTYAVNPWDQKRYLFKQIRQKSKQGRFLAAQLYQAHLTVDDLPLALFKEGRKPGTLDQLSRYLQNKKQLPA